MAQVTGFRLTIDNGAAGPSLGDTFSSSDTLDFDDAGVDPVAAGGVDFGGPEVPGVIYTIGGESYFVPDEPADVPAGATGTLAQVADATYLTGGDDTHTGSAGDDFILGGATSDETGTGADAINGAGGDDRISGGDGDDDIRGGNGDDIVEGGAGNDTVSGGAGDDTVSGGTGDDVLYGDENPEMHLSWAEAGADEQDISAGFTQNTGGVEVTVSYSDDGNGVGLSVESSSTQYVDGGEPFDPNSAGELVGDRFAGDTGTVTLEFAGASGASFEDEVTGVSFRINDIDENSWDDVVTVRAYDANGNQIDVTLTYQGATTTGTDPSANGTGAWSPSDAQGSALVEIAGPVARIEVDYDQAGSSGQLIWLTDVHFTAVPTAGGDDTFVVEGDFGDDVIIGGELDEVRGDRIDLSALSGPIQGVYGGDEAGTLTDGTDTIDFTEIEALTLTGGDDRIDGSADSAGLDIEAGAGDDEIIGGSGNDLVQGGAGADSISGGAGNDEIIGGDGDDVLSGGEGNDTIEGGDGDDIIDTGDGTNKAAGGAGNDQMTGGSGDDWLYGEEGDDVFAGGSGGNTLYGGDDADTFHVGIGTDTITGGEGGNDFDTLSIADADDAIVVTFTGDEAGTFFDDDGDSGVFTEIEAFVLSAGNDVLNGAASTTSITVDAGAGDDRLIGGAGDDTFTGGDGDDTFVLADDAGDDWITDFDLRDDDGDGFTNDQFDVTGLMDAGGSPVQTHDVTVTDTNGDGTGDAVLVFPNGETVVLEGIDPAVLTPPQLYSMGIPCFVAGTMIATPQGARPVEQLKPGDHVIVQDGPPMPVRWTGQRRLDGAALAAKPDLRPINIRAGALGNTRDLMVSPQHRMVLGARGAQGFAPARWLAEEADGRFRVAKGRAEVTYVHLMLSRHAVVFAEGAPTESFFPGPVALGALDPVTRASLLLRYPHLARVETRADAEAIYGPLALPEIARAELAAHLDGAAKPGRPRVA